MNNEVTTFFENINNRNNPSTLDISIHGTGMSSMSSSMTSGPTTPNGEDSCFYSNSDMDSDVSKDTLMDMSQTDGLHSEKSGSSVKKKESKHSAHSRGKSPPLKRTMETSQTSGDPATQNLPNKKRPMSSSSEPSDLDLSIHNGTDPGITLKDLVDIVKTKGRRGLYQEYAGIKSEPPNGTFEVSK